MGKPPQRNSREIVQNAKMLRADLTNVRDFARSSAAYLIGIECYDS
jgi:hypothetical protein